MLAAFTALVLLSTQLLAQIPENLQSRLQIASRGTSLESSEVHPWHLRLSFSERNDDGSLRESGSLEEWWAAPDQYRRVVSTPTYSATETSNGNLLFRSAGMPRPPGLIADLLRELLHPLPDAPAVSHSRLLLQRNTVGPNTLDCITLGNDPVQGLRTPLGLFPAYCFDAGSANLRVSYRNGTQVVIRNHVTRFQNQMVAGEILIKDHGVVALRAGVQQLVTYTPQAADFTPSAEQQLTDDPVELSAAETVGLRLRNVPPDYPRISLEGHRAGVVILRALIGKDGRVRSAVPLYSPDHRLTEACVNAVRQCTYRPFKRNGQVREVETTLTFTFNLL